MSACLQVYKGSRGRLHIISCYAPTRAANRETKDEFFQELENIITSMPTRERYIILGDFNARVGSRTDNNDLWDNVRGLHRYGLVNDAGKELILSLHQATICNTWFKKKDIYKQTWQHPKCKQWSCIDYVVMRQKDRRMCLDVTVKRGAECITDHQLLCTKLRLNKITHKKKTNHTQEKDQCWRRQEI